MTSNDPDMRHGHFGWTGLHAAAYTMNTALMKELLSAGTTPLHISAHIGDEEGIRLLVDHGADAEVTLHDGGTPSMLAAQEDHAGVLKYLIHQGADIDRSNNMGLSPLLLAVNAGRVSLNKVDNKEGQAER
eukprot:jgi/Bigna1/130811/aug1.12_g5519